MGSDIRTVTGFPFLLILAAFVAILALPVAPSAAKMASPTVRLSLSVSPDTVTWPTATSFERRLSVTAGTRGLDGVLKLRESGWENPLLIGQPFETDSAWLEGPGILEKLAPASGFGADTAGSCVRGSLAPAARYRLALDPHETTTVVASSRLVAPPLPGMGTFVGATIATWEHAPDDIDVPLGIAGKSGVAINASFVGAGDRSQIRRRAGKRFRLQGRTVPRLANRTVRITALRHRQAALASAASLGKGRVLTRVRTDRQGRFRTGALKLNRQASWILGASLARAGQFNNLPSCLGEVLVRGR